jgi:hypothetical protein
MTASNSDYIVPGKNDTRPVDELVAAALMAPDRDDDGYWDVIAALHWRGSDEVLHRAAQLCHSFCHVERRIGAATTAKPKASDQCPSFAIMHTPTFAMPSSTH